MNPGRRATTEATGPPAQWLRRSTAAALLAVLSTLALVMVPASPVAAETTAEVETTLGGFYRPGDTTVLLVTVAADRAVTGTITITEEGDQTTERSIDVPGGSAKTFPVPVTISPWAGQPAVVVRTSDGEVSRPVANLQQVGEIEPVAVMPSLAVPGLVERADLAVDLGQARMVPFDPAHLDRGPASLSAAAAVVATEADITALADHQVDALLAWVSAGGNLYLDGSVESVDAGAVGRVVAAAGGRFAPVDGGSGRPVEGRAWLGTGTVYVVGDTLSAGRYDGLVQPRFGQGDFGGGEMVEPAAVVADLSFDAGFRGRSIGGFMAVLLVYIALVGPILWLVLSRTRREPLLWLAVPALATVVSVGIWGSGRFFRQGSSGAHVTLVAASGTDARATSDYLISSSGGGFTGVVLDDGWEPMVQGFDAWNWRIREAGLAQATLDGNRLGADVPPSGVVVARAASSAVEVDTWDVTLTVDGSDIAGSVTNTGQYDLVDVVVFAGDRFQTIDSVDSGQSIDFELSNVAIAGFWDSPVRRELATGGGRGYSSSPAALQRWLTAGDTITQGGLISIVGWTTEAPSPLDSIGGEAVEAGRTGYVASFPVAQIDADAPVGGPTVRTNLVDFRWSEEPGGGMMGLDRRGQPDGQVQVAAYDLPPGSPTDDLVIEVPDAASALDLWIGGGWVDSGLGVAEPGDVLMRVPPAAVIDGTVHLRVLLEPPDGPPRLRSATADELAQALNPPDSTGSDSDSDADADAEGGDG